MSTPPPSQYEIEKEFHDFIMRPELRGFNAAFARWRRDKDDSHVSRMHSPHVPEVKSWLYESADQLYKACSANLSAGKKALEILSAVVARHDSANAAPVCDDALDAAWFYFRSVKAEFAAGMCDAEKLDAAKNNLVETLGRMQTSATSAADIARDLRVSGGE